jgi:hypothetical protein
MTLLVMSRSEFGALRSLGIATTACQRLTRIAAERLAILDRTPSGSATRTNTPADKQMVAGFAL